MKPRSIGCTAFVLIIAAISFPATTQQKGEQAVRGSMIVSTEWLAQHLEDDSLVLFQVGEKDEYAAGHIPGAQFLTLADISATRGEGLSFELTSLNSKLPSKSWVSPTNLA